METESTVTFRDNHSRKKRAIVAACVGIVALAIISVSIAVTFHFYLSNRGGYHKEGTGLHADQHGGDTTKRPVKKDIPSQTNDNSTLPGSKNIPSEWGAESDICIQHPRGVFAARDNCAMYINCSSSLVYPGLKAFYMECHYPKLFDYDTKTCLYFTKVSCGKRFEAKYPCDYVSNQCHDFGPCIPCEQRMITCKGRPDGSNYLPEMGDPNSYVICLSGRTVHVDSCKEGMYYDTTKRACVIEGSEVVTNAPTDAGTHGHFSPTESTSTPTTPTADFTTTEEITTTPPIPIPEINITPDSRAPFVGDVSVTVTCTASSVALNLWETFKITKISEEFRTHDIAAWSRSTPPKVSDTTKYEFVAEILEGGNLQMTVRIKDVTCNDGGFYECSLLTGSRISRADTSLMVRANASDPVLEIPQDVPAGTDFNVSVIWNAGFPPLMGDILWEYKAEKDPQFSILSGSEEPQSRVIQDKCSHKTISTLTLTAENFWNDATFRTTVKPMPNADAETIDIINKLNPSSATISIL